MAESNFSTTALRHNAQTAGNLSRAMGLLKGIVGGPRAAKTRPDSNEVLRRFLEIRDEAKSSPSAPSVSEGSSDPIRDAAYARIRQLRVHAA